jgi:phage tail tube protein FII
MKLFIELNMMQVLEDQTIYMSEVDKLIGSAVDNDNANRQRRFRERQKQYALQNVTDSVTKNNESKSIEIDIEKETDIDITTTTTAHAREIPFKAQVYLYIKENYDGDILSEVDKFYAYNEKRGWDCLPNWQATADLWMARVNDRR